MAMKRIVIDEVEGLEMLLGERVTLWCVNYIYTGKLVGVNDFCVRLTEASVVYETGPLDTPKWKDAQALPQDWYVTRHSIESFGLLK